MTTRGNGIFFGQALSRPTKATDAIILSVRNTHDRAFKEWAAVVRAMERGETILLIRKGGIVEEGGAFSVQDPEFFLFPNHTHQNTEQLQPRAHAALAETDADRPDETMVRIGSYATVEKVFTVPDEAALAWLDDEHLWTRAYMLERLWYKPQNPLYAMALRVYNLPEPFEIPYLAAYGGCTSWVTLDGEFSTDGATPALDDAAFADRLHRIRRLIEES